MVSNYYPRSNSVLVFLDGMLVAVRYSSHTRLHVPILRSRSVSAEPSDPSQLLNRLAWLYIWFLQGQSNSPDFQAYLKSINGPMDAVLINKCAATSTTVVLPFPPPEDCGQSVKLEMPDEGRGHSSQAPGGAKRGNMLARRVIEEMRSLSSAAAQPNRTDAAECEVFSVGRVPSAAAESGGGILILVSFYLSLQCKI